MWKLTDKVESKTLRGGAAPKRSMVKLAQEAEEAASCKH